jgi:hypothetical protein
MKPPLEGALLETASSTFTNNQTEIPAALYSFFQLFGQLRWRLLQHFL